MPLTAALSAIDQVLKDHPGHADTSTIRHARALLQRAHDKQKRAPGSYNQIVERSLTNLKQKG